MNRSKPRRAPLVNLAILLLGLWAGAARAWQPDARAPAVLLGPADLEGAISNLPPRAQADPTAPLVARLRQLDRQASDSPERRGLRCALAVIALARGARLTPVPLDALPRLAGR